MVEWIDREYSRREMTTASWSSQQPGAARLAAHARPAETLIPLVVIRFSSVTVEENTNENQPASRSLSIRIFVWDVWRAPLGTGGARNFTLHSEAGNVVLPTATLREESLFSPVTRRTDSRM